MIPFILMGIGVVMVLMYRNPDNPPNATPEHDSYWDGSFDGDDLTYYFEQRGYKF